MAEYGSEQRPICTLLCISIYLIIEKIIIVLIKYLKSQCNNYASFRVLWSINYTN